MDSRAYSSSRCHAKPLEMGYGNGSRYPKNIRSRKDSNLWSSTSTSSGETQTHSSCSLTDSILGDPSDLFVNVQYSTCTVQRGRIVHFRREAIALLTIHFQPVSHVVCARAMMISRGSVNAWRQRKLRSYCRNLVTPEKIT